MEIEKALGAYLTAHVTLVAGRVYSVKLPQKAVLPALTFFRVSTVPIYSHQGFSHLTKCRFQISCWAVKHGDVREIASELRDVLDGYSGMMGTTEIGSCLCVGDRDMYEPAAGIYQAPLDFMVAFRE
jgi:hypothetical protein